MILSFYLHYYLDVSKLDDWKNIRISRLRSLGGHVLCKYYSSMEEMLHTVYPEHDWNIDKNLSRLPTGYWSNKENQRKFMDNLSKKLDIFTPLIQLCYELPQYQDY